MGIITRLMASPPLPDRDAVSDHWWAGTPQGRTAAGVRLDNDTALQIAAVWSAVKILSETLASLPLILYRRDSDDARSRARNHPLYHLLHDAPNAQQTSFEWREMMQTHLILRGNAYSERVMGRRGWVDELRPLHPDQVTIERRGWEIVAYHVSDEDGRRRTLLPDEVFHVRGLSLDGVTGVSVITYARESLGLTYAAESFGARVFSQDARPGGVLEHPGPKPLSQEAAARLRHQWQQLHTGLANAHRVAVLEEGITWKQVSMTSEDAQFLQTRQFQISEIARWFRIPPHMLGDLERATFSNIEQQGLEFVTYTLMPWLRRWEQAIGVRLLGDETYFAEFLVDALVRGDLLTRYRAYAIGRSWGWESVNDIRRAENRNPIAGGDTYLEPLNYTPVGDRDGGAGDEDQDATRDASQGRALDPVVIARNGRHSEDW